MTQHDQTNRFSYYVGAGSEQLKDNGQSGLIESFEWPHWVVSGYDLRADVSTFEVTLSICVVLSYEM